MDVPLTVLNMFALPPQVLVSLVFINLLHALGLVHLRPYSRSLGERLLLPAICNSVHSVLMTWAKASSPYANLFLFTVPLLPLLTLGFSFALKVSLEYLYAPLALILHSLSLITFTKVSESVRQQPSDVQPSVFDIYYAQLVIQGGVLGFLWLLHPDKPWLVLKMSSWRNLLFHGYLLAIVLLGMVLNFLVCTSTLCVSPLAAALDFVLGPFITSMSTSPGLIISVLFLSPHLLYEGSELGGS
uniref:Uncharacterized protein n=1 Tax=Xiphophorus couchianus TaxID=32473 RepID=A0A3B5LWU8_9TELE